MFSQSIPKNIARFILRCLTASVLLLILLTAILLYPPSSLGQTNKGISKTSSETATGGPRTALVIGNAKYTSAPLRNPVNDARAISSTLKELGFQVTLLEDAGQKKMKRAIDRFGEQLRDGGVGLFYYSGHGIQVAGRNYLIPVNAEIVSEQDVEYESVDAGRVLAKMDAARNGMNLVILDACRNNPYARSFRSASQGLATLNAPSGTFIAYATAPGSVASDGTGRNGLYTGELVRHMNTPGLKLEDVFKRVRAEVQEKSGNAQVPWDASSLTGDFYFIEPQEEPPPLIVQAPPQEAPSRYRPDEEAWEIVKDSENPTDLQFFIDQFPQSLLLPTAKMHQKVLQAREERRRQEAEQKLEEASKVPVEPEVRVSVGKIMYVPKNFFKHVVEYRGHTYALTRYRYTFQGAQDMAERFGGHLVTVDDRGENIMLTSEFRDQHNDHAVWIGFSDLDKEGKFVWEDGSSGGVFGYSNWGDWQPDNWKDQEDCTELRFKSWNLKHMPVGGWNDARCSGSYLAFIEWDGTSLKHDLAAAQRNPTRPTEQLAGSGFGMGWKLSAMALTLGAGLSSLNQAKAYNDLASKNKSLRDQYSTANTVEERNSLESEYSNNQKQMNSEKSNIRTLDGVTLVGMLALAYMFVSDDDDPVKVVSENNFTKPRNSGLQFSLQENHMHLGWQWNF